MSSMQMTMRGLRDYPPEIRNGIYEAACAFDGKMPDLIKALRQDPELYKDAMHVFLKSNTYILHDKNGWTFGDMSAETVASIQRLHLIVDRTLAVDKDEFDLTVLRFQFYPLSRLKHITFTDIYTAPEPGSFWHSFEFPWMPSVYCVIRDTLNGLFKGSTSLRSITWLTCLTLEEANPAIEMINSGLVNAKMSTESCEDGKTRYVWEVADRGVRLEGTYLPLLYESEDGFAGVRLPSIACEDGDDRNIRVRG